MAYYDDSREDDEEDEETWIPYTEIQIGSYSIEGVLGSDHPDEIARARYQLAPVRQSMVDAGFYAYSTFNQKQQLSVASDDEAGRFDVSIENDELVVTLWTSSPGLYVEEENEWRRRAMERMARIAINQVAKGQLHPGQEAFWDDDDKGVAVQLTYRLPLEEARRVGAFVLDKIPELEALLDFVERQVA